MMADETKIIRKGWALPLASRKYHYFNDDDSVSICGNWWFMADAEAFEDSGDDHKDNCAACKKKKLALDKKAVK